MPHSSTLNVSAAACNARCNLNAAHNLCHETVDTPDYAIACVLRREAYIHTIRVLHGDAAADDYARVHSFATSSPSDAPTGSPA